MKNYIIEIIDLWKQAGVNIEEKIPYSELQHYLSIPAQSDINFSHYGNYCGPNIFFKKGENPPIDCLDMLCKIHDKFFYSCKTDRAFQESTKILIKNGMIIEGTGAEKSTELILNSRFNYLSLLWRQRIILIILVSILIILSIITLSLYIWFIIKYKNKIFFSIVFP